MRSLQGAVFGRWAGDCTGAGPCIVTMDADRQATAVFLGPLFEDGFETGDTGLWSSTVAGGTASSRSPR